MVCFLSNSSLLKLFTQGSTVQAATAPKMTCVVIWSLVVVAPWVFKDINWFCLLSFPEIVNMHSTKVLPVQVISKKSLESTLSSDVQKHRRMCTFYAQMHYSTSKTTTDSRSCDPLAMQNLLSCWNLKVECHLEEHKASLNHRISRSYHLNGLTCFGNQVHFVLWQSQRQTRVVCCNPFALWGSVQAGT